LSKKIEPIHYHLDDFQFAQAKKLLAISKGLSFTALKDDMIPFVKLQQAIVVIPLKELKKDLPIVYWQNTSLLYGFIVSIETDEVIVSNIKGHPLEWSIKKKHILGQIKLHMPYWYYSWKLKKILQSEIYKIKD